MDNATKTTKRVAIDPVTRVEGHGKVTLLLDDDNVIQQARLHIVEFRGFEKFIQGRPYWELPLIVQRLCGICPVSHHLAAAKAIDQVAGLTQLTESADKLRRLLHLGQTLQSHALHFFHLASPDLLFGFESDIEKRNIVGVIKDHPEIALQGVKIRKFGQEVIKAISGKRIHGIAAIPGGMNKPLAVSDQIYLRQKIEEITDWCQQTVCLARQLYEKNQPYHSEFATITTPFLSLVDAQGNWEIYDGNLRIKDPDGSLYLDQFDAHDYTNIINEQVKSWSYMKFPFLKERGPDLGWYRVGPLARLNNCDQFSTPLAEAERKIFTNSVAALNHKDNNNNPKATIQATLSFHWARMIEALHCAEAIKQLLDDPACLSSDLMGECMKPTAEIRTGIGVIEAPRGTLFHHYEVNQDDIVTRANLIVSTTNNNQAMNESIRQVANRYLSGKELTPELLNQIEVAIRAYDPCLSCATHAVGKMPLEIELGKINSIPNTASSTAEHNGNITIIDRLTRNAEGLIQP